MVYLPNTPAVIGIFGSLGGGKTLTAVDIGLHFIKNFNFVVSNVQLKNLSKRQEQYYQYVPDISQVKWFDLPVGSLRGTPGRKRVAIILDELPELLDQYTSGKDYWVKQFLSWLRHTSKRGQFVFVITQDPSFILKPVRLLCSYWIKCEDMSEFRLPFIKIKLPFFRDFISRRTYNRDGTCINGSLNTAKKSEIGKYYTTSQGLSLLSSSTIPNEFKDPFSQYIINENKYQKYIAFTSYYILLTISLFFILLFL